MNAIRACLGTIAVLALASQSCADVVIDVRPVETAATRGLCGIYGKSVHFMAPGVYDLNFEIWATVTGSDADLTNESLQTVTGGILITTQYPFPTRNRVTFPVLGSILPNTGAFDYVYPFDTVSNAVSITETLMGTNGGNPTAGGLRFRSAALQSTTAASNSFLLGTFHTRAEILASDDPPFLVNYVKPASSSISNYSFKTDGIMRNGVSGYSLVSAGEPVMVTTVLTFPSFSGPSSIRLSNVANATIITGGTGTLGAAVSNSPSSGYPLNYTMTASVQSGSATLGSPTPAAGSVAFGSSQSCTVSATSSNIGLNTIRFTASDPNAPNSPQVIDATLTILDHAAAAFADSSTVLNLDFGMIPLNSGTHSLHYQIRNLPATYRAALDLDSVTEVSDAGGVFSTGAAFTNLAPGMTSSTFDVALESTTPGSFSGRYVFNLSDQKDLSGHAGMQTLTLSVTANVVPEPTTFVLVGMGVVGLLGFAWRRQTE